MEQSQVEQSIRESQSYLATCKNGADVQWLKLESDIQLAQTRLTDLKAVIAKKAELAALEQAAANSLFESQPTKARFCNTWLTMATKLKSKCFSPFTSVVEEDGLTVGESGILASQSSSSLKLRMPLIAIVAMQVCQNWSWISYSLPASQVQLEYFKRLTGIV